jgi:hypothetical protein
MGIRWGFLDCLGYEVRKGFEESARTAKMASESWGEEAGFHESGVADEWREKGVETRRRCEPEFALDRAGKFCGQEESRGVLLGAVGANVEAENVSTTSITVAQ